MDDHGVLEPKCVVDHRSLRQGAVCYECGIAHEDSFVTGKGAMGRLDSVGRGPLTDQDKHALSFVAWRVAGDH